LSNRSEKDETAKLQQDGWIGKSACRECRGVFLRRHEQLTVRHATIADEMIADEKHTVGSKRIMDGRIESWRVTFMAEFMDGRSTLSITRTRRGVGAAILSRLEEAAVKRGALRLQLQSSINAEAFYARHGYQAFERTTHRLRSVMRWRASR
jgi:hypothetical protein